MTAANLNAGTFRHRLGRGCGLFTAGIGFVVLVGWATDSNSLKSVFPGLATMKANTALSFLLLGLSLLALRDGEPLIALRRRFGLGCALVVAFLAALTFAQYLLSRDFGIDQLLFADRSGIEHPGRMSPATAVFFILVSTVLVLLHCNRGLLLAQRLNLVALLLGSLCGLGYLYGVEEFYAVRPFSTVAAHTAVTFVVLSAGILATSPAQGLLRLVLGASLGGQLIRRGLPIAIVLPIAIGWLRLRGQQLGWYDTEFGLALFALSNVVVFSGLVIVTAVQVERADAARQTSERRLRLLLEGVPQLVWTCLPDGYCDYLSRQWSEYTGIPEAEQLGYGWSETVHPDDRAALLERWQTSVRKEMPLDVEFRIRARTGEYRWFKTRAVLFQQEGVKKWFGTNTDIHDKRLIEDELRQLTALLESRVEERTRALQESERRFRAIFNLQFQFIGLMSLDGVLLEANRTALVATGATPEEVIGKPFWETKWWLHDPAQQRRLQEAAALAAAGQQVRFEATHPTTDGALMWVDFSLTPFRDEHGNIVLLIPEGRDITERKRIEETIRASLAEKEVLLKEIHHRVKNNLQIVSTLLHLQSGYTRDPQALEMFEASRNRVRSMALIHERLYRSHDLARVNFSEYVRQLTDDVYRAYKVVGEHIVLEVEVDVPPLPIDVAIPCGLILNELVSNALKHAFKESRGGLLRIELRRGAVGGNVLTVADTGSGLPAHVNVRDSASFGLQLVNTLVDQLHGTLEVRSDGGTTFSIAFPDPR